jgi:hypothetical protein
MRIEIERDVLQLDGPARGQFVVSPQNIECIANAIAFVTPLFQSKKSRLASIATPNFADLS